MVCPTSARLENKGLIFSKHRLRAIQSDVAARNRNRAARLVCFAEHNSLDQIDCHPAVGKGMAVAWSFQANQFETVSERLPRIHLSLHEIGAS